MSPRVPTTAPAPVPVPAIASRAASDRAVLASDVHLGPDDPATVEAFLEALPQVVAGAQRLFLLGDLFDAWIGDDVDAVALAEADAAYDRLARRVAATLAEIAAGGCAVGLGRGNRDFLLGERYAQACGAALLPDQAVVLLGGEPALLSHGDELCTSDVDYQRFRAQVRAPAWQAGFLAQPRAVRMAVARRLRGESESAKREKAADIMDVDADAVRDAMRSHGIARLVHGHTHRPDVHRFELDGAPAERWVLSDWDASAGRGDFLVVDAEGWRRVGPPAR